MRASVTVRRCRTSAIWEHPRVKNHDIHANYYWLLENLVQIVDKTFRKLSSILNLGVQKNWIKSVFAFYTYCKFCKMIWRSSIRTHVFSVKIEIALTVEPIANFCSNFAQCFIIEWKTIVLNFNNFGFW